MSEQNAKTVRQIFEAFHRRDVSSMLRYWHTDAVWRPSISPGGIEGNTYVGHYGLRRWLEELAESWESFEAFDMRLELVGNRVVALGRVRGRGLASGAEIERELAQVWELDDGKARQALEVFLALADPDVVAVSRVLAIEGGSYRGHDGVRVWWNDLLDVFPDFRIEVVSIRDAGDIMVAALRNRAHGEGSDTPLEELVWQVAEWRDGKIIRWQMYGSEAEALEAAGLRE